MTEDVHFERARFLFWPVAPSTAKPTPAEARASGVMTVVGELPLADRRTPPTDEWSAVNEFLQENAEILLNTYLTQHLRRVLRSVGARKFIPHRPPSWDYDAASRAVELCFYHNTELHETIYLSDPNYVMAPSGELLARLTHIYAQHGVDEFDENLYPLEPDTGSA